MSVKMREREREIDLETDRQTGGQLERETQERERDRHTYRQTDRQRETETEGGEREDKLKNVHTAKGFGPCQTARTAQAVTGRNCLQM